MDSSSDRGTNDIVKWEDVDCIGKRDGEFVCKHSGEYFAVLNEGKLIKTLQNLGAIRTGDSDSLKKKFNNLYIRKLNRANEPDTGTPESGAYYHVDGKLLRDKPEPPRDIVRKGQKVAEAPQGLHMDTTISSGSTLSQAEEPPLRQDALTKVLNENRKDAAMTLNTDNSTTNNPLDLEALRDAPAWSGASQNRYYAPMSLDPQLSASPGYQNPLVNPDVSKYHSAGGARWDEVHALTLVNRFPAPVPDVLLNLDPFEHGFLIKLIPYAVLSIIWNRPWAGADLGAKD
ncbi:hypothetical protein FRB97_001513 [Tulasnella sp. 331]|nr:hypothetical protein FRB97_001513 [Tulasnella sp. 331]